MSFTDQTSRTSVVGTGAEQVIPFLFPIVDNSDITVIKRLISTGVATTLTETTHYTVLNNGQNGGSITTVTPFFASTFQIHIVRNTPMTQEIDLEAGGSFSADNVEAGFDKNTRLIIENSDQLDRTLKFPNTDPASSFSDMPNSIDRASKNLTFDSAGKPTASVSIETGSATFTSIGTSIVESADADAVRDLIALGWADVMVQGATGDGSADDRAAIVLAVADADIVLFPAGTYKVASDLTIDEDITLWFLPGAKLAPATGVTITMNGQIKAGNYQIFSHTGTGKVVFKDQMLVNIVWYSTGGDGSLGDKWVGGLAIATAVNEEFHTYYLPGGAYHDTSTVLMNSTGFFDIVGDGERTTKVFYSVADTTSCWKFSNASDARFNSLNIRDIWFHGFGLATGAAIEVEFLAQSSFANLVFQDWKAGTSNSKAFWCKGIETVSFKNILIDDCTIGFHIANNAKTGAGDSIDTHFEDIYVQGDDTANSYAWKITADGQVHGFKIDGTSNIAKCKFGVWYEESVNTTQLFHFEISNLRFEQGLGAGVGWAIYFNPNVHFWGVTFRNISVGSANGFYVRNAAGVLFESCQHIDATGTSFDIDTFLSRFSVIFINCLRDLDTTFSIAPDLLFSTGNKNGLDSFSIYGARDGINHKAQVIGIVNVDNAVVSVDNEIVTV